MDDYNIDDLLEDEENMRMEEVNNIEDEFDLFFNTNKDDILNKENLNLNLKKDTNEKNDIHEKNQLKLNNIKLDINENFHTPDIKKKYKLNNINLYENKNKLQFDDEKMNENLNLNLNNKKNKNINLLNNKLLNNKNDNIYTLLSLNNKLQTKNINPFKLNNKNKINKYINTKPILGQKTQLVKLTNGNIGYLNKNNNWDKYELKLQRNKYNNDEINIKNKSMLETPFDILLERVEKIKYDFALKTAIIKENKENNEIKDNNENNNNINKENNDDDDDIIINMNNKNNMNDTLWVDKYAPLNFTHLLSPEKINREVLFALKEWDNFVFKDKNKNKKKIISPNELLTPSKNNNFNNNNNSNNNTNNTFNSNNNDPRPEKKIILLSGPPGYGKTTLAHILATLAGYNIIEVNASDERGSEQLKERITRVMQSNSILSNGKPNCLILDEIDGADSKAVINELIKIVKAPLRKKSNNKGKQPLTRPLICICNDIYSPSIRPLKEYSNIFQFYGINNKRLMDRLREICRIEKVKISSSVLSTLISTTNGDIRSCLNTLQLMTISKRREIITNKILNNKNIRLKKNYIPWVDVSLNIMSSISNKIKDEKEGIYKIWSNIFQYNKKKNIFRGHEQKYHIHLNEQSQMNKIIKMVDSYGTSNFIVSGIYENFPQAILNDPSFMKYNGVMDWLEIWDILYSQSINGQGTIGYIFLPYTAAAIHLFCCIEGIRPEIKFPKKKIDINNEYNNNNNNNENEKMKNNKLLFGRILSSNNINLDENIFESNNNNIINNKNNNSILNNNNNNNNNNNFKKIITKNNLTKMNKENEMNNNKRKMEMNKNKKEPSKKRRKIKYKFQAGFTNAVRRTVKIKDLI